VSTGRQISIMNDTAVWLKNNIDLDIKKVFMRNKDDFRKAYHVKKDHLDIIKKLHQFTVNRFFIFDDDVNNIKMFNEETTDKCHVVHVNESGVW
jgi:excinuclease UvrABC helicase subunit UvrB